MKLWKKLLSGKCMMNANASAVTDERLKFEQLNSGNNVLNIKGYFAVSTAPINVDDQQSNEDNNLLHKKKKIKKEINSQEEGIKEIGDFLKVTEEDKDEEKELVIMIHGYNTKQEEVKKQYEKSFKYIEKNLITHLKNKKLLFIGYRWPSENFSNGTGQRLEEAIKAFPIVSPIIDFLRESLINRFTIAVPVLFILFIPWFVISYLDYFQDPNQLFDMSLSYSIILSILLLMLVFFIIKRYFIFLLFALIYLLSLTYLNVSVISIYLKNINNIPSFVEILFFSYEISTIIYIMVGILALTFICTVYLTFIILRITCYFRDKYRANNFAVPDLVDLIKQLNTHIIDKSIKGYWDQENQAKIKRIKLSFIAHSMGAFVATDTIRTLADAFEQNQDQNTISFIGKTFSLGRLILASPDISIEAILPGRSNFLETSLIRCDEAYLFSNQGDTVLRGLSAIANYFSFPACTAQRGFRLGNLVINETQKPSNQDSDNDRKITEFLNTRTTPLDDQQFRDSLSIVCRGKQLSVYNSKLDPYEYKVAKLFTYFDCTDYEENDQSYLTEAKQKKRLGVSHHVQLVSLYFFGSKNDRIDIHGGYFEGEFSQKMIYGLACLGFVDFLKFIDSEANTIEDKCRTFSEQCRTKGIQGLLSESNRKKLETQT